MKKGFKDIENYRANLNRYLSKIGQNVNPEEMDELVKHFIPTDFLKKK